MKRMILASAITLAIAFPASATEFDFLSKEQAAAVQVVLLEGQAWLFTADGSGRQITSWKKSDQAVFLKNTERAVQTYQEDIDAVASVVKGTNEEPVRVSDLIQNIAVREAHSNVMITKAKFAADADEKALLAAIEVGIAKDEQVRRYLSGETQNICPNGVCETGEDASTCPGDCPPNPQEPIN